MTVLLWLGYALLVIAVGCGIGEVLRRRDTPLSRLGRLDDLSRKRLHNAIAAKRRRVS